ncbi:MAG: hypothetical protein M1837_005106 [Sclerophora amabilis]|nr:MAG: hypothetical protein M1837_005106 [Sclerophora amabilis]
MPKAPSRRTSGGEQRAAPYNKSSADEPGHDHEHHHHDHAGGSSRPKKIDSSGVNGTRDSQPTPSTTTSHLDIKLPGESDQSVPIYDSCDQVRTKIHRFVAAPPPIPGEKLKSGKPKMYTQAKMLRDMGNVNSNSLRRFLEKKGVSAGAESGVYYEAYCFFEKLRIFNGEKKTAQRTKNEKNHPHGFDLVDSNSRPQWVTCGPGENPAQVLAMANARH